MNVCVEGNSKLQASSAVALTAGPGLGGALVQLLTAPIAITADAASFVVSVVSLSFMRAPEPPPPLRTQHQHLLREAANGLRFVWKDAILRAVAGSAGVFNLFGGMSGTLLVLYLVRNLHIAPGAIGLIFATYGVGAFVGALVASRLAAALGIGPTLVGGLTLACVAALLIPLAGSVEPATLPLLVAANVIIGAAGPVYFITLSSLSVAVTPGHFRGRVSATTRLFSQGTQPLGPLLGGLLGQVLGVQTTLVVAGCGTVISVVVLLRSPVPKLRIPPAALDETSTFTEAAEPAEDTAVS